MAKETNKTDEIKADVTPEVVEVGEQAETILEAKSSNAVEIDSEKFAALMQRLEELEKANAERAVSVSASVEDEADEEAKREAWLNERIPFEAFKDDEKYKDDIHVGINGYNYVIQRGVLVYIPRFVYNCIKDADRQNLVAAQNSEKLATRFKQQSKEYGID